MKRIILFSNPIDSVMPKIESKIFDKNLENKKIGYLVPAGKDKIQDKYLNPWLNRAEKFDYELTILDSKSRQDAEKINNLNNLIVTGGNAFEMLKNFTENGYIEAISDFLQKENIIYSGFSAGAMLLTPSLSIADEDPFNENEIDWKSSNGLYVLNFELFPHFEDKYKETLEKYQHKTQNKIVTLTDEEYLEINV